MIDWLLWIITNWSMYWCIGRRIECAIDRLVVSLFDWLNMIWWYIIVKLSRPFKLTDWLINFHVPHFQSNTVTTTKTSLRHTSRVTRHASHVTPRHPVNARNLNSWTSIFNSCVNQRQRHLTSVSTSTTLFAKIGCSSFSEGNCLVIQKQRTKWIGAKS